MPLSAVPVKKILSGTEHRKCPAIEVSGGWADTSLVPSILFLLGSVMTAVFDMYKAVCTILNNTFETHTPALSYCNHAARFIMMELEVAAGDAASGVSDPPMPGCCG